MRFSNLEAEIKRAGMSVETFAKEIHLEKVTMYNRLKGKTKWTLSDMVSIQKYLNNKTSQNLTLDYLFHIDK